MCFPFHALTLHYCMDSLTNEVVWGVVDGRGCGERGRGRGGGNVVRGGGVCGERLKSRRR